MSGRGLKIVKNEYNIFLVKTRISVFHVHSQIFSGIFLLNEVRKSCFRCGQIYDFENYTYTYFKFVKFCWYCCVEC